MKRILAAAFMVLGLILVTVPVASATAKNDDNVTICHRTASVAGGNQHNGYDLITVDPDSILKTNGHDTHEQQGNGPGGDLIPPFHYDYSKGPHHFVGDYPGKGDWSLIETGCAAPEVTTTTSVEETTTTTTTQPEVTTTTVAPTTTTLPPTTTTVKPKPKPPVKPTTTTTFDLRKLPPPYAPPAATPPTTLPYTGSGTWVLGGIGLGSLLLGLGLLRKSGVRLHV